MSARRRPWAGGSIVAIGLLHLACAPLFYGDSVRSILAGGVINAVDADPAVRDLRALGFWYLATGVAALGFGALTVWVELHVPRVPYLLGWVLVGIAAYGVLLVPLSGFWLFLIPAALAFVAARRTAVARTPIGVDAPDHP